MRRAAILAAIGLAIAAIGWLALQPHPPKAQPPYPRPAHGDQTYFPALEQPSRLLTIEAATDVSFMRPFITVFQKSNPQVAVQYVDSLSSELLESARGACRRHGATPDIYLTISTDHLVELANDGCGAALPKAVAAQAPRWAQWRREVVAFSLEPAVFVYDTRRFTPQTVPRSHLELVEAMRAHPEAWRGRIGTYDIEKSGPGYNYASFDARQAAIYGRLIESFGRGQVKSYCCSNVMVEAVRGGEIMLAYNVQLSYAYAGQRQSRHIGVVLPSDYQAIQSRSVMVSRDARNPADAVAFVQTLLSPRGKALAVAMITPPPRGITIGSVSDTERAGQIGVSASQLALRDAARRAAFIQEWRRAIGPPDAAEAAGPPAS